MSHTHLSVSDAPMLDFGLGNPSLPLSDHLMLKLVQIAADTNKLHLTKYSDPQGDVSLREKICAYYADQYHVHIDVEEVFITDGATTILNNMVALFPRGIRYGMEKITYSGFLDIIKMHKIEQYSQIETFDLRDYSELARIYTSQLDLLYLCNPNNPTGLVLGEATLRGLVAHCSAHGQLILHDSVYADFAKESAIRSIYQLGEMARHCAIEIRSLSKSHSLAGLRLAYCIVPKTLSLHRWMQENMHDLWRQKHASMFFGANSLTQQLAIACFTPEGLRFAADAVKAYQQNAARLKAVLPCDHYTVEGGEYAPFLWIKAKQSEDADLLFREKYQITGSPGRYFGASDDYLRISCMETELKIQQFIHAIQLAEEGR